jgi:hypothetical protein
MNDEDKAFARLVRAVSERRILDYILDDIMGEEVAQDILRDLVDEGLLDRKVVLNRLSRARRDYIVDSIALEDMEKP